MIDLFRQWLSISATLLALGVTAGATTPVIVAKSVSAQTTNPTTPTGATPPSPNAAVNFSDVPANYWAQPFIQALAARNIITGFPDGTFKPEQAVDRAEFAAMIQKAFEQKPVRQLSQPGFKDVPADYWGATAIEEAYEAGFMGGYPDSLFQPNEEINKVQAIAALANGLNLSPNGSAQNILTTYYTDASTIPAYAVNEVAAATQANVVVNYPNVKQLNPLQPLTRAAAAAHLYQALVRLGQVQPLANNLAAANYIVGRTANASQIAPTNQSAPNTNQTTAADVTDPSGSVANIYALAALDFTTLATLLKATGLAESLQKRGPFTVFAPTDEAFAALPKETLQKLQKPENSATLMRILMYHVVPGERTAQELSAGEVKTLANRPLNVQINPAQNQIAVNDARVIQPNMQASNGVIHAVNEVLIPPNVDLSKLQ